jgi:hypothetical protein
MSRSLSVLICVLGIAVASIPAYASPTSKKVTFTCNSFAPNVITATATVTLCDDTPGPNWCTGQTFVCPTQFVLRQQRDNRRREYGRHLLHIVQSGRGASR